jgi:HSP20 family protein
MPVTEELSSASSVGIDEAIGKVENLYRAVTGMNPPLSETSSSPIPVEKDPSKYVEEQVERLLTLLGPPQEEATIMAWTPPMSIWDNEKEFLVCVDLPGVTRKDVEITVNENLLTIGGRRPLPTFNDHRLRASERPLGPFVRKVLLPPTSRRAEASPQINAQLREGVLEIRISKEGTRAEKPKPIPVN